MKTAGIYKIQRIGTDQCYVGSSHDIDARWRGHKSDLRLGKHHAIFLQRAWVKHAQEAFVFSIVEICEGAGDELKSRLQEREQHWIDTLKPAFNSRPAAFSMLGFRHSEETKARLSAMGTGVKHSPERCAANKPFAGRTHTAETRAKLSARKRTPEEIEKSRLNRIGRKATPEQIERNRLAKLGTVTSEATKEKLRQAILGRKHSGEAKTRMRKPKSPEHTEKLRAILATRNAAPPSAETRAKMSAAAKARHARA